MKTTEERVVIEEPRFGFGVAQRRPDRVGSLAVARDWNAMEGGPSIS